MKIEGKNRWGEGATPVTPRLVIKKLELLSSRSVNKQKTKVLASIEDTRPETRAIGVSHTACKDEFRQNL